MAQLRVSTSASTTANYLKNVDSWHLTDYNGSAAIEVKTMRRDNIRVAAPHESDSRVSLRGEFDILTKRRLSGVLRPCIASQTLTVDLAHATFIDASTLGVFVHVARCRREIDATRLRIVNASAYFRRLFSLCHLDDVFEIEGAGARTGEPPATTALP